MKTRCCQCGRVASSATRRREEWPCADVCAACAVSPKRDYHVTFTLDVRVRVSARSKRSALRVFELMDDARAVAEGKILDTRNVSIERAK